jgi:hypothetical protein
MYPPRTPVRHYLHDLLRSGYQHRIQTNAARNSGYGPGETSAACDSGPSPAKRRRPNSEGDLRYRAGHGRDVEDSTESLPHRRPQSAMGGADRGRMLTDMKSGGGFLSWLTKSLAGATGGEGSSGGVESSGAGGAGSSAGGIGSSGASSRPWPKRSDAQRMPFRTRQEFLNQTRRQEMMQPWGPLREAEENEQGHKGGAGSG